MPTTSLSTNEIDFWCNTEKSVADSNPDKTLDKKMMPRAPRATDSNSSSMPGFLQQQHWESDLHTPVQHAFSPSIWSPNFPAAIHSSSRFAAGSQTSYSPLKESSGIGRGTSLSNKNKFRHHSFGDNDQYHLEQNGRGGFSSNALRYKTELCRPFQEYGKCKYGEKCQFAHGFQELRNLSRHPKYKTELCRTFHSIGFCPYGPRCHFIHDMPFGAPSGNRQPFSGHGRGRDLQVSFSQEPRHKVKQNLNFLGFSMDNQEPPKLLDSPIWRFPPQLSSFSASEASTPSGAPEGASAAAAVAAAAGEVTGATEFYSPAGEVPAGTSFANNAFDFGLELNSLITPVGAESHNFAAAGTLCDGNQQQQELAPHMQTLAQPRGPVPSSAAAASAGSASVAAAAARPGPPFNFQQSYRQPNSVFDMPSGPPVLLSDRDRYHSSSLSSGTINGSENRSPVRRLPIFSRLSISDN
ncbi:mRNA decay activator protein ZFP36L2-like [Perognathus longimembris pacificus]|uniref:mRNA decay activator protein ZFP36L2-like n=1 Tax=Perognathus longimembris pacificus TaxID=214514 RepID=UPI0020197CA3|nr:mRNA decay activator protein ZFP36L2-like [Perognathus longimembris pacificus]